MVSPLTTDISLAKSWIDSSPARVISHSDQCAPDFEFSQTTGFCHCPQISAAVTVGKTADGVRKAKVKTTMADSSLRCLGLQSLAGWCGDTFPVSESVFKM